MSKPSEEDLAKDAATLLSVVDLLKDLSISSRVRVLRAVMCFFGLRIEVVEDD